MHCSYSAASGRVVAASRPNIYHEFFVVVGVSIKDPKHATAHAVRTWRKDKLLLSGMPRWTCRRALAFCE